MKLALSETPKTSFVETRPISSQLLAKVIRNERDRESETEREREQ